jgi:hypothetical protein
MTVSELVRAQAMAEGPQICDPRQAMVYVDKEIDAMSNTELLDRISDAITTLTAEDKTATPTSPRQIVLNWLMDEIPNFSSGKGYDWWVSIEQIGKIEDLLTALGVPFDKKRR